MEQVSGEEDSEMPSPPDASPDESVHATSSWQSLVDSITAIDHSGYSSGDSMTKPPSYQTNRTARVVQGDLNGPSRASSSDFPQDHHMMYYPHDGGDMDTTLPYFSTASDYRHDNGSYDRLSSDSRNNSSDDASYVFFPSSSSSAVALNPSGFTPINQNTTGAPAPLNRFG